MAVIQCLLYTRYYTRCSDLIILFHPYNLLTAKAGLITSPVLRRRQRFRVGERALLGRVKVTELVSLKPGPEQGLSVSREAGIPGPGSQF